MTILLITGTPPGEPGVGGVLLEDLIRAGGAERFECAWLAARGSRERPWLESVPTVRIPRRYETAYRPCRGLAGEVVSGVALRGLRPGMLAGCVCTVQSRINETRPELLLAVLDSPGAIQVARRVAEVTDIPLVSIVWDDVDLFCRQAALDRWTRRWVERDFAAVLRRSRRVAVICENMQRAYAERYGIEGRVLRHGLPEVAREGEASAEPEAASGSRFGGSLALPGSPLRIGFAGSNTAPDCLRVLIECLDARGWACSGRPITLRMLGARYLCESRQPQSIEFLGWRDVAETRRLLAECDVLYLPQTFDRGLRSLAELSFPTKLSTYVAARRPILLHAPEYASLSGFWTRHDLGPQVNRLEASAVGQALEASLDTARGAGWMAESRRVHREVLSAERFEEGVRWLLGEGEEARRDASGVEVLATAEAR